MTKISCGSVCGCTWRRKLHRARFTERQHLLFKTSLQVPEIGSVPENEREELGIYKARPTDLAGDQVSIKDQFW